VIVVVIVADYFIGSSTKDDILEAWREHDNYKRFPTVARMAADILATSPATLTVERWFFHARCQNEFNRPYRPETLSDIMICKGALRVEEKHEMQERLNYQERLTTGADPNVNQRLLNAMLEEAGFISDDEDNAIRRSERIDEEVELYEQDQGECESFLSRERSHRGASQKRKGPPEYPPSKRRRSNRSSSPIVLSDGSDRSEEEREDCISYAETSFIPIEDIEAEDVLDGEDSRA
jgi:hypothetical protein